MRSDFWKVLNNIRNDIEKCIEPSPFSADGKQEILKDLLEYVEAELAAND